MKSRLASPHLHCPICQGRATPVLDLTFSQKRWLPDKITLALCVSCDFAYASPADADDYVRYYAETTNDLISSDDPPPEEQRRYDMQAGFLHDFLSQPAPKQVLDIGCGAGGLLRTLRKKFGHHAYHGADPNLDLDKGMDGITLSHAWQDLRQTFDLIILSHTLEHMVDLEEITTIKELLAPGGFLYVEVPDASHYAKFPRREYLYYIDRLHINHFTHASLKQLLESKGLSLVWAGRHDFHYKDGKPYPACCVLATNDSGNSRVRLPSSPSLVEALPRYLEGEADKAKNWRRQLSQTTTDHPILVYGFGDNFFRALNANGPLADFDIRAVVDQRWQILSKSRYAGTYSFIGLTEAMENHLHLPIVVTVSFGGEAIANKLRESGFSRVFIL